MQKLSPDVETPAAAKPWDGIRAYLASHQPMRLPSDAAPEPMASEAEAMEWLRRVSAYHLRRMTNRLESDADHQKLLLRIYVDGALVQSNYAAYAARPDDRTLGDYVRRLDEMLGGKRFGIMVNDIQIVAPELWQRALGLARVNEDMGLADGSALRVSGFFGNYDKTGFGAHVDYHHRDVLQYVVWGRKRMRFWTREYVAADAARKMAFETRGDYGAYIDGATSIEADPGEWICWPGQIWHVGETLPDTPHFGLSFVFENLKTQAMHKLAARFLMGAAGERLRTPLSGGTLYPSMDGTLPLEAIEDYVGRLQSTFASDEFRRAVVREMAAEWLAKATAGGFNYAPDANPSFQAAEDKPVRLAPGAQVSATTVGDELVYSANGHTWRRPASPALARLFETLGTGDGVAPSALAARLGLAIEDVKPVLDHLASARALQR
jgi:hypothetical protein